MTPDGPQGPRPAGGRPGPTPLDGASVLVAGATGGLGSALAAELDRRGARLTLVGRDGSRLEALPCPGARVVADLRDPEACASVVRDAVAAHGRLDVLVNAVGVVAFGEVRDLGTDTLEELFLTNAFVPVMLAREAVDRMEPGGTIVNISGMVAERNLPGMAAYGASKAAVRSFDEALARELRRTGIRVLDARPPHTETGLAGRALQGTAPRLPPGLDPSSVAATICDAIRDGVPDLPSEAFTAGT